MGFRRRSHSSLWGQLGLAANLCLGSQPFEELSAPNRNHPKAKVAQKDVPFCPAESQDFAFQADSSTGSASQTSRLFRFAVLGGSSCARSHSKDESKAQARRLNAKFIVGLGLIVTFEWFFYFAAGFL